MSKKVSLNAKLKNNSKKIFMIVGKDMYIFQVPGTGLEMSDSTGHMLAIALRMGMKIRLNVSHLERIKLSKFKTKCVFH